MPVQTYPFGALEANCHLLCNDTDAIVIDPTDDTDLLLKKIAELGVTLRAILLTHLHFDHTYGCAELSKRTGLPVFVGREDWELRDIFAESAKIFGMASPLPFTPEPLEEGTHVFGSLEIQALHCPGHSPGSLCYYVPAEHALFSGDVLFFRSVGRSDLPGGDADDLMDSIKNKLYVLPDDTTVYCGHGENTLLGDEKVKNMHCRG